MYKLSAINLLRAKVSCKVIRANPAMRAYLLTLNQSQPALINMPHLFFSTNKKDKEESSTKEAKPVKVEKTKKDPKKSSEEKKPKKLEAAVSVEKKKRESKAKGKTIEKDMETVVKKPEYQVYTLKFNSPILPFAKFPLT